MFHYLQAEHLKCKRTFAKKLIVMAPVSMSLLAGLSSRYLVQNGYNWWYILILPGFITLITALVNQVEEKKLRYRSVYMLPISLPKIWIAKILLIAIYVSITCLLHLIGIMLGQYIFSPSCAISMLQMTQASFILIVVSLWQIPFCLFLSKQFGFMATVLVNTGIGIVLNFCMVAKSFWWVCPYSWSTRLMCPVLRILPNGTLASPGDAMLNPNVIPVGISLSIVLFFLLLVGTAIWFSTQEVK